MSAWRRRIDRRNDGGKAHGITFIMQERNAGNVRAEVALTHRKLHANGTAALTLALGQWKYGDELIAQLFTRETPKIMDRQADGWIRVQIYLGTADLDTAAMLERIAADIREKQP